MDVRFISVLAMAAGIAAAGCQAGRATQAPQRAAAAIPATSEVRRLLPPGAAAGPIARLEVDSTLGDVHVAAGAVAAVYARTGSASCTAQAVVRDGCLQVRAGHTPRGAVCRADLDIIVPSGTHVGLRCARGDARLRGALGSLDVRLGTGDVTACGRFAHVEARVAAGSLAVDGMTCGGHIVAARGDVCLQYAAPPPPGRLTVRSTHGNVRISMPPAPVRAALSSVAGRRHNTLGHTAAAPFAVTASAAGDISLRAASLRR